MLSIKRLVRFAVKVWGNDRKEGVENCLQPWNM